MTLERLDLKPPEPCFSIYFKAISLVSQGRRSNLQDLLDIKVSAAPVLTSVLSEGAENNLVYDEGLLDTIPDEILLLNDNMNHYDHAKLQQSDIPKNISEYFNRPLVR